MHEGFVNHKLYITLVPYLNTNSDVGKDKQKTE